MRIQQIAFSLLVCLGAAVLGTGCNDDDPAEASIPDQQIERLKGSWKVTAVTLDDVSQDGYDAFRMVISANMPSGANYTIDNNPDRSPWLSAFGGHLFFDPRDPAAYLIREDEVSIKYSVSATVLTFEFTYHEGNEGGRISGVSGEWKFVLEKE